MSLPNRAERRAIRKNARKARRRLEDERVRGKEGETWRAIKPEWWTFLTLFTVGCIAKVIIAEIPLTPPPDVTPETAVSYVLTSAIQRFGWVVVAFAFLGSCLRAVAHDMPGRKRMDFAGKLLAVGATFLSCIAVAAPYIVLFNQPDVAQTAFYGR